MKPTWERGGIQLYLGDCLDVLPTLDGKFAVVADPPYGMAYNPKRSPKTGKWFKQHTDAVIGDDGPFDPSPWLRYKAILWGANHYASRLPDVAGWLVWDKRRGGTYNPEFIASDCELAWTNVINRVKVFSHLWGGLCRDDEIGEHYHPTQKPIALMEWCIRFTGGTVFDPYMGSGTTILAAIELGRRAIGIEISEEYFKIAVRRIDAALDQKRLPFAVEEAECPTR